VAAEILGRLAQFGTLGLIARTLTLAEFGQYGLALVLGFLVAQIADFGLHLLVTRQLGRSPDATFAKRAFTTKLWLNIGLMLLTSCGAIWSGYGWAFNGLVISSLLYSLADFSFAVLRARHQLHHEAGLVILYRLALLGGVVLVFLTKSDLTGIACVYLAASGLVGLVALRLAQVRPSRNFTFDWVLLRQAAPIGLAIVLSLLAFKIDVPLLQLITGDSAEVGLYNAAYKLFEPLLLFPAALLAGFFPLLSQAATAEYNHTQLSFKQQLRKLLLLLSCSGLVISVGTALVAGWVVPLLFGTAYNEAVITLILLALAVPFLFVNSGLTHALLALEYERLSLYFFGVCLVLNIGANFMLIPSWGRNGAAIATILTELGLTIMCSVALRWVLKRHVAL
jgi:O-antigen/teichoic acid export membrane protein